MIEQINQVFNSLEKYCKESNYKGWDPYDGLNSRIFQSTPLSKWRLARLAWIQFFKRNPINLRKLALVPKDYNPQALGLFVSAYANLYKIEQKPEYLENIRFLTNNLLNLQSDGFSGSCWGYNFDWQARAFFQPKYAPTVVASTFIGYAILDAYELLQDERLLQTARSICDFILKDLNRTYDEDGNFAFSYSPTDHTVVFNASLLGSRMLARVYHYTKEEVLKEEARKSVVYCCKAQKENGAWTYGTLPYHQWIDNFHTGYNLECISEYSHYTGDYQFDEYIQKGLKFYIENFFTEEGISKYYHNKVYPVDINCPAQLMITLFRLNKLDEHKELLEKVFNWTVQNMFDKKGYFYYQIKKGVSSKIPYMRWAQSWMFNAISFYLLYKSKQDLH